MVVLMEEGKQQRTTPPTITHDPCSGGYLWRSYSQPSPRILVSVAVPVAVPVAVAVSVSKQLFGCYAVQCVTVSL
jgi:hypothetical protein